MPVSRNRTLGFRKSHAFVIGINEYRALNANLKTAVKDSVEIAKRLKALQGFDHVLLMNNVGKDQIEALLDWLRNKDRPANLQIPDQQFLTANPPYASQVAWLKLAEELTATEKAQDLKEVKLDWESEHKGHQKEWLYLASEVELDIQPEDSIVFYYAGHGFPGEVKDGPSGYLAPTDAKNELLDNQSLLPMDEVYQVLSIVNCKHTLLVLDCCFAGKFRFSSLSRAGSRPFLSPMYQRRYERYKMSNAWQVLVSAGPEQTANDSANWANIRHNSPFAATLIEALEGKADLPTSGNRGKAAGDGIITASELFLYVWDRVEKITSSHKPQHPGLFPMAQHREGEFIFINPTMDPDRFKFAEDPDKNPYKGLHPYETEDAQVFFGRERVIDEVLGWIRQEDADLLFITGPSGSGKSSLVKAGVFPLLNESTTLLTIRPGELLRTQLGENGADNRKFHELKQTIRTKPCVLLIDQYEELLMHPEQATLEAHLMEILAVISPYSQRVIFTLRSDFEWQLKCSPLGEYWEKKRIYRLPPMDLDELRQALTGPAWWAMYDFKDSVETNEADNGEGLINEILEEVAHAPGALPLLSFTMQAFYEIARHRQQRLILEDYREVLKGVEGALSTKADELYHTLLEEVPEKAQMLQQLMIRMVNVQDGAFTRRRVFYSAPPEESNVPHLSMLNELDFPGEQHLVPEVIRRMESANLVIQGLDENGHAYVEPAHDSLITHWDNCRQWIAAFGKEQVILQRQLWQAVQDSKKFERIRAASSNISHYWDTSPKLMQLIASLLERTKPILQGTEHHPLQEAFLAIEEKLSGSERTLCQEMMKAWREGKMITPFDGLIITGVSGELLAAVMDHGEHWLNKAELKFIHRSWEKRTEDILELKRQRDEALDAQKRAEAKTREALANELAFRAQMHADRTTAFRLAEYALAIDPHNPKALHQLIQRQGFSKAPVHATLTGHSDAVWSAVFSSDGTKMLTASREIFLWDAQTGVQLNRLSGQERVCFSSDDQQIAYATADFQIVIWDVVMQRELFRLPAHQSNIISLQYSPDGSSRLLSAARDKRVRIWNLETQALALELTDKDHTADIKSVSYSPDGKQVVAMARKERSGSLIVWNAQDGRKIGLMPNAAAHHGVAKFLSDTDILSVSADNKLRRWTLPLGTYEVLVSGSGGGYFSELAISPDGQLVAIACSNDVQVHELRTGKELHRLRVHSMACNGMTFSPDSKRLATYSDDRTVRIWKLNEEERHFISFKNQHQRSGAYIKAIYSPAGNQLLSISRDRGARLWNIQEQQELRIFAPGTSLADGAFSADGRQIVLAAISGEISVWNIDNDQKPEQMMTMDSRNATFARFLRDDKLLVSADEYGAIVVWDAASGQGLASLDGHSQRINYVDIALDSQQLITASSDETIKIWELPDTLDGAPVQPIRSIRPQVGTPRSVVFSPDGKKFVVTGFGTLKLYNSKNPEAFKVFHHEGGRRVWHAGFAQDGTRLVSNSDDRTVKIWDLISSRLSYQLADFDRTPKWIDIHPRLWQIAITCDDHVHLQPLDAPGITAAFTQHFNPSVLTSQEMEEHDFASGLSYAAAGWWTQ